MTDSPQSFDGFAEAYDRFTRVVDKPMWPWLSSPDVGVAGGRRALDAGCGGGRRCVELAARFDEVVGIDVSEPLVALARARRPGANVRYEVADVSSFTDADGFDLVHSAATLHHVDPLEGALHNLRSLVRPGGVAVLSDLVDGLVAPWKRWLWRHGAVRLTPLADVVPNARAHGLAAALDALRFPRWPHRAATARRRGARVAARPLDDQPRGAASRSTSHTTRSASTRAAGTSAPS